MIARRALCDYVRVAAWEDNVTPEMGETLKDIARRLAPAQQMEWATWMQYDGARSLDGLFVGMALQPHPTTVGGNRVRRPHWILHQSGEAAHVVLSHLVDILKSGQGWLTRIDLQVTIPIPHDLDMHGVYEFLADTSADHWHGRKRKVTIIQSGDGMDTIYIGSRKSETFIRIYVKLSDDGRRFLRFEVEYKGASARAVGKGVGDGEPVERYLRHELDRLPVLPYMLSMLFKRCLGTGSTSPSPIRATADSNTLRWILTAVEPAILRLLHSHEHGYVMRRILDGWLEEASKAQAARQDAAWNGFAGDWQPG